MDQENTPKTRVVPFLVFQLHVRPRLHQLMVLFLVGIISIMAQLNSGVNRALPYVEPNSASVLMENGTRQDLFAKVTCF